MTARNEILEAILALACRECNVELSDAKSQTRISPVVGARQAYVYLARMHSEHFSTREIGELISRDHSTIIHATRKVNDLMKVDSGYARKITKLVDLFLQEIGQYEVRTITKVIMTERAESLSKQVAKLTTELDAANTVSESKNELIKDQMHQLNALHAQVLVLQSENKMLKDLQNNK